MFVTIRRKPHGQAYESLFLIPRERIISIDADNGEVVFHSADTDNEYTGKISYAEIDRLTSHYITPSPGMTWRGRPVAYIKVSGEAGSVDYDGEIATLDEDDVLVVDNLFRMSRKDFDQMQREASLAEERAVEAVLASDPAQNRGSKTASGGGSD